MSDQATTTPVNTPVESTAPAETAPVDAAPPTPAEIRKFKLKIDGKESEYDEAEVIRLAQMGKSAHQRYEEAAGMRKQAEEFINLLKTDPRAVLSNPSLGIDLRQFAENYLYEQLQEESMSPEQKEQRNIQNELKRYKEMEAQQKVEAEEREHTQMRERYVAEYDQKISKALLGANLPKTPATVARMTNYLIQAIEQGYDLEPADLINRVEQDYISDIKTLLGSVEGSKLKSLLGDEIGKKLRESDLQMLKSTQESPFKKSSPKTSSTEPKKKRLSGSEWRAQLMKDTK